jgi:hypothetical protein
MCPWGKRGTISKVISEAQLSKFDIYSKTLLKHIPVELPEFQWPPLVARLGPIPMIWILETMIVGAPIGLCMRLSTRPDCIALRDVAISGSMGFRISGGMYPTFIVTWHKYAGNRKMVYPCPYLINKIWTCRKPAHKEGIHWAPSFQLGFQHAEDLKMQHEFCTVSNLGPKIGLY